MRGDPLFLIPDHQKGHLDLAFAPRQNRQSARSRFRLIATSGRTVMPTPAEALCLRASTLENSRLFSRWYSVLIENLLENSSVAAIRRGKEKCFPSQVAGQYFPFRCKSMIAARHQHHGFEPQRLPQRDLLPEQIRQIEKRDPCHSLAQSFCNPS